jgi:hypothetical protein
MRPTGGISQRFYTESGVFCAQNAKYAIEHWESLAETTNEAMNKALDIFAEVCMNQNESEINTIGNVILENLVKVRDANQLINSIKYKNSRLKTKIQTKINNKMDDVSSAITNTIGMINSKLKSNTGFPSQSTQQATEECFAAFLNEAEKLKECDRILENYNKISKRFNLDRIVTDVSSANEMYQAVTEIAQCIDTYSMPFKSKYCFAIENAYYALNKNHMNYPSDKIIEAVTDYFIFSSGLKESNIPDVKSVKNISVLFEQNDFSAIDYLFDQPSSINESAEDNDVEMYGVEFSPLTEADLLKDANKKRKAFNKDLKKSTKKLIRDAKQGNPDEHRDDEVKQMVDDFRKQCLKNQDSKMNVVNLKSLVTKLFAKNPYQIVYELPNLFGIIRASFIITSLAINPILGVISFITDKIIKLTLSRKQTEKIVTAYKNEIEAVKNKIEKSKDNQSKENLEKYKEELEKDLKKIKEYENDLYTDEENDERGAYDDDLDFDDDWDFEPSEFDDIDFNEMASIIHIANLEESILEGLLDTDLDGIVYNNIFKLNNDSIDAVTDFSITVPVILEKNKLCEVLTDYREQLRETAKDVNDYIRIDCLNDNIHKLSESNMIYNTANSTRDVAGYLSFLNEMVKMNGSPDYVLEMNFTNTLKIAINNLKKTALKLSDKEKQASNTIDVSVNNVAKGIEKAMMNDNREAVIRGSVIPSASKCIKIAITLGVAWAVQPAVAVIGAIGGLACSKKMQSKERQLALDDIEIELKMCERYLKKAEEEDDMQKIRQLEIIQRNLQRQQQRIKYRMQIVYNQNVPSTTSDMDD